MLYGRLSQLIGSGLIVYLLVTKSQDEFGYLAATLIILLGLVTVVEAKVDKCIKSVESARMEHTIRFHTSSRING